MGNPLDGKGLRLGFGLLFFLLWESGGHFMAFIVSICLQKWCRSERGGRARGEFVTLTLMTSTCTWLSAILNIFYPGDPHAIPILNIRRVVCAISADVLRNHILRVQNWTPHNMPENENDNDDRRRASIHPPTGSDNTFFSSEATCTQSPQADSPISYHSLGIACRVPSEYLLLSDALQVKLASCSSICLQTLELYVGWVYVDLSLTRGCYQSQSVKSDYFRDK